MQVAIFHSAGEAQRHTARKLRKKYWSDLGVDADIFTGLGQQWGWSKGDHVVLHFLCELTGLDESGQFFVVLRGGNPNDDTHAVGNYPATVASSPQRSEQQLYVVDVIKLLLEDMKMGSVLLVLEGVKGGDYTAQVVASVKAALEKAWSDNLSSLARRLLQRLVVVVPEGGRLGALSESLVEVQAAFEEGYDQNAELRRLFAAAAARDVYLLHQTRGELQQLRVAAKVLRAAHHAAAGGALPDAYVAFHPCDDEYGVSRNHLCATVLHSSWVQQAEAIQLQAVAGAAGCTPAQLPALMFDLACRNWAGEEHPEVEAIYRQVQGALLRLRAAAAADTAIVVRQCACAVIGFYGEPTDGGDMLVASVGLLLALDRSGVLWWPLREWQRACELAEYLGELMDEGCQLGSSADCDPLALLRILEEEGASTRLEDECVRLKITLAAALLLSRGPNS